MKIKAKKDMPYARKGTILHRSPQGDWGTVVGEFIETTSRYLEAVFKSSEKEDWFEIIEEENRGRWVPEYGEGYYFVHNCGHVKKTLWDGNSPDTFSLNQANVFKSREEAEHHKRFLEFQGKLREIADGYEFIITYPNYYIYFDHSEKGFRISNLDDKQGLGDIYFKEKIQAQKACDMANRQYKDLFNY